MSWRDDDWLGPPLPMRLTLLVLLLRPPEDGLVRGATILVAGAMLAVPRWTRAWQWWLVATGTVVWRIAADWPLADNHIYLLAYWCLAVALCQRLASPADALGQASRRLVGAAFACAVIWKAVLSPDFLDARFFRVTLLTDERFARLVTTVGQLAPTQLQVNRAALVALPAGIEVVDGPVLVEPAPLRVLAATLTWAGVVLEGGVAVASLMPPGTWVAGLRHVLLLAFAALTYAVAPVAGFGWLLTAMGLAQCTPAQHTLRTAYVVTFGLVTLYAESPLIGDALGWLAPPVQ